jgi:peptidoglycan hydrolase-like protein with peptidoglycan-binding domain
MRRFGAAVIVVALLTSACTSGGRSNATTQTSGTPATTATTSSVDAVAAAQARVDAGQAAVADAQGALSEAGKTFCGVATDYVEALDRYGKLFTDEAATVGDVKTTGADLVAPREAVSAAGSGVEAAKTALTQAEQELIDAQAALTAAIASASSKPAPTTTPATATPTTLVPRATMERVQQAEKDLADAEKGITDQTLLTDATAEYNSAAFALQIAWLQLLSEAGCLTDKEQANAVEQVTAYTTQLQTELKQVGYYTGAIDGIYGPQTVAGVKKLQADSGLPETGFVDAATSRALDEKLAALGQQTAAAAMTQTASVQTVLKLTGFWTGAIDGKWTDELTAALKEFQKKLGVKPTGEVDAATLGAFEQALSELKASATASGSAPVTVTAATTATVTRSAGGPATVTTSATAHATVTVTATTTATPTTKSVEVDLSGEWKGEYGGAYTGTFVLNWKQTGSKLSGTIELSAPQTTLSLNGTIAGTTIEFGTVGSAEITYSGTVSGDKMSGTYTVNGSPGGDWSATRS